MRELLDLIKRNWRELEKQVFFCCLISIFAKTVDVYGTFNNIAISVISIKFSGHPRDIFANATSSLKF